MNEKWMGERQALTLVECVERGSAIRVEDLVLLRDCEVAGAARLRDDARGGRGRQQRREGANHEVVAVDVDLHDGLEGRSEERRGRDGYSCEMRTIEGGRERYSCEMQTIEKGIEIVRE